MITVGELIKQLEKLPQDYIVYTGVPYDSDGALSPSTNASVRELSHIELDYYEDNYMDDQPDKVGVVID